MRLDRAIVQNMADVEPALGECASNQQAAVTIERLALGAHQAHSAPQRVALQSGEARAEIVLPRHRLVIGDAVAIETLILRPTAKRLAIRQIRHPFSNEPRLQIFARKPREKPRIWRRADVRNSVRAGIAQQRDETVGRDIGVTDAEQIECRHRLKSRYLLRLTLLAAPTLQVPSQSQCYRSPGTGDLSCVAS